MATTVYITVEDIDAQLLIYNQIQLLRAPSVTGTYTLVATLTLVADDQYYSFDDSGGSATSWYKYRFYHSSTLAATTYSNPFQAAGTTRKRARQLMLANHRAGMTFLSVAAGSTIGIVATNDPRIKSSALPAGRGKNAWLYKTVGANPNEQRLISNSTPSTGLINVSPNLSSIPADNDEWEWHWIADPEVANQCLNNGLMRYWYIERVPITGVAGANEYLMDNLPWLTHKRQITGLWWTPEGSTAEQPWSGQGRWWNYTMDRGNINVLMPGVQAGVEITLEALRTPDPLYTDDSVLSGNLDLKLVAAFAYDELLTWLLEGGHNVTNVDRKGWEAIQKKFRSDSLAILIERNAPQPRYALPVSTIPSSVHIPYTAR